MSYTEYHVHRINEHLKKATEFSDGKPGSYLLSVLKSWVDKGTSNSIGQVTSGPQDLIIMVESSDSEEFRLKNYSDVFISESHKAAYASGNVEDEPMIPFRFINLVDIPFTRINLIYDPRSLIKKTPTLDIQEMLKSGRYF
ncbi:hypothetical protein HZA96_07140 [Candidatus Woesearchaeota archaeon]|nr:hypothetical protein [Candidatus Woesearchaeota archaeon]